jgi:gonadotropin-releasing hormone receptor
MCVATCASDNKIHAFNGFDHAVQVTFLMMPLEIVWAATVSWRGGDLLCRIMAFFRIFGLFLSSFVLVCLAIDR